jgi:hypothetical protein
MPGAFAPRFAVEAAFLILLGVGAGYADLRPAVIVALVAGGWLLVALIELAVWRSQAPSAAVLALPPDDSAADDEPESAADAEVEPEPEDDYPLRSDVGDAPSEEVESYTRVLSASSEERSPVQQGD